MAAVDAYQQSRRRIHASVTQPATPKGKQRQAATIQVQACVYCGSPAVGVVCAAHMDLLGQLEAER